MKQLIPKKHKYVSRYVSRFSTDCYQHQDTPENSYLYICIYCARFRSNSAAENRLQQFWQKLLLGVFSSKKIFRDTPPIFLTASFSVFVMKNLRTPAEVCEYLRISRTVLYRMEKDGELLPYRFRGKVFYEQADVDAYLDSKKVSYRTLPGLKDNVVSSGNNPSAIKNGVIVNTPISPRSSRAEYFAQPTFGTAVAEIDRNYQEGGSN